MIAIIPKTLKYSTGRGFSQGWNYLYITINKKDLTKVEYRLDGTNHIIQ